MHYYFPGLSSSRTLILSHRHMDLLVLTQSIIKSNRSSLGYMAIELPTHPTELVFYCRWNPGNSHWLCEDKVAQASLILMKHLLSINSLFISRAVKEHINHRSTKLVIYLSLSHFFDMIQEGPKSYICYIEFKKIYITERIPSPK